MKCVGCGDSDIVINSCAPLCQRCVDNTRHGGEFGDLEQEVQLTKAFSEFELEVYRESGAWPVALEAVIASSVDAHDFLIGNMSSVK